LTLEKFIPVFIDVKPAENLEPSTKQTLCFVGILANSMQGIRKLKAYKNTPGKKKIDSAKKIIDTLNSKKIEIDAIGFAGKSNGQFVTWACDTINRSRKMLGAEWELKENSPENLLWKNHKFHISTALGLSLYTSILPLFGLRAEILSYGGETNKIKLCLDALPHNSEIGMKLMEEMRNESEIAKMWKANMERGAEFEVGTFLKYKNQKETWSPAKHHPNMVLADWFAVSCMANIDPEQLQKEGKYSSSDIDVLSNIWKSSETPVSTPIRDLDDPKLIKQIKDSEKNKKAETKST
jgi:hypothetical protein